MKIRLRAISVHVLEGFHQLLKGIYQKKVHVFIYISKYFNDRQLGYKTPKHLLTHIDMSSEMSRKLLLTMESDAYLVGPISQVVLRHKNGTIKIKHILH